MPPPIFHLKCLGFPELRGPDGKVVRIRVKKHLALLCYLAVERRRYHDRDRLVGLLWPTVSVQKGRHSIATAISVLRTIFGRGAFPTNRTAIRFTPAGLQLDLDRLEAGRVLGVRVEGEQEGEGEPDLDVDGFLRGFEIHDAPEFAFWKEREHARRLPAIHAGLLTLIDHGRRRGSHDEIMQQAERLLALDHLAEEGIRAKMEALALVGDRFSAIRVFDEWKERLAEELGAEPSSLVEGMAGQLRKRGWEPAEPNPVPPVPAEQWRDRRFVGRKAEYRQLYETWEAVHQYRPQHFMVAGDSGVGKTTLAQRLVTAAGLEGASVSRVQCYQMEQGIPFGMIGGLVAGLMGRPGVAATAPEALAEVGRIVPQVREHFRHLPAPKPSEGESARLLFAEGVMDLLRAVMEERPLLLVVDDLQHSDEASMAVLHLVMRRIVEGRFMVAVVTDVPFWRQQWSHWRSFDFTPTVRGLELEPMNPEETRELAEHLLEGGGEKPPLPIMRALCRASHGFPLIIELVTSDWRKHGAACTALAFRSMTTELGRPHEASRDCSMYIARALAGVSEQAMKVLGLASLLGSGLDDPSWYSLLGMSVGQTLESLAELTRHRLLRETGNGLELPNEVVRALVYSKVPPAVRRTLHSAIADRLLGLLGPQAGGRLELAWHLTRAKREQEAVTHLVAGAAEAKRLGAPDEAILALESAAPTLTPRDANDCFLLAAGLYQEIGRWQESLQATRRILGDEAEQLAEARALEVWAIWNLHGEGAIAPRGQIEELLSIANSGNRVASDAVLMAARIACSTRSIRDMTRVLDEAIALETDERLDRVVLLVALGSLCFHLGRRTESAVYARRGAAALADKRADSTAARLSVGLGALNAAAGDYQAADRDFSSALEIAERLENHTLIGHSLSNRSVSCLRLGRYDDAIRNAERAIDRLNGHSVDSYILRAYEVGSLGQALIGRPASALDWLKRGDRAATRSAVASARREWALGTADVLWVLGRRRQALDAARGVILPAKLDPGVDSLGQFVRWLARTAIDAASPVHAIECVANIRGAHQLDAFDDMEVAAAICELEAAAYGFASMASTESLRSACNRLPLVVTRHAADLGLLMMDSELRPSRNSSRRDG